jgi:hypothetical protein
MPFLIPINIVVTGVRSMPLSYRIPRIISRMPEPDRVGINIVVTGASAAAGFAIGGPVGAAAGAVLPEIVREITARRVRNVERVTSHACFASGIDLSQLRKWIGQSEQHRALLEDALDAAWAATDEANLRTLGYVLADGISDDAKIDVDRLIVQVLRQVTPADLRVLSRINERMPYRSRALGVDSVNGWKDDRLHEELPIYTVLGELIDEGAAVHEPGKGIWLSESFHVAVA